MAVAVHGHIEVKVCCGCAFVGPRLAAEGLAGAQPSAGATPSAAVGSRMADDMHLAPRHVDRERAGLADSVLLSAAIAAAVAVVNAGLPHSGQQPAGNSQPSEPPDNKIQTYQPCYT